MPNTAEKCNGKELQLMGFETIEESPIETLLENPQKSFPRILFESDVLSTLDLLNELILYSAEGHHVAIECLWCWQDHMGAPHGLSPIVDELTNTDCERVATASLSLLSRILKYAPNAVAKVRLRHEMNELRIRDIVESVRAKFEWYLNFCEAAIEWNVAIKEAEQQRAQKYTSNNDPQEGVKHQLPASVSKAKLFKTLRPLSLSSSSRQSSTEKQPQDADSGTFSSEEDDQPLATAQMTMNTLSLASDGETKEMTPASSDLEEASDPPIPLDEWVAALQHSPLAEMLPSAAVHLVAEVLHSCNTLSHRPVSSSGGSSDKDPDDGFADANNHHGPTGNNSALVLAELQRFKQELDTKLKSTSPHQSADGSLAVELGRAVSPAPPPPPPPPATNFLQSLQSTRLRSSTVSVNNTTNPTVKSNGSGGSSSPIPPAPPPPPFLQPSGAQIAVNGTIPASITTISVAPPIEVPRALKPKAIPAEGRRLRHLQWTKVSAESALAVINPVNHFLTPSSAAAYPSSPGNSTSTQHHNSAKSIWQGMDRVDGELRTRLDFSQLDAFFSAPSDGTLADARGEVNNNHHHHGSSTLVNGHGRGFPGGGACSPGKPSATQQQLPLVSLLSSKRSLGVNIFLKTMVSNTDSNSSNATSRAKWPILEHLRHSHDVAVAGDTAGITIEKESEVERLKMLLQLLPSDEEVKTLRNYTGDPAHLGEAERFLLALLAIPHHKWRVEAMVFRAEARSTMEEAARELNTLLKACTQLRTSSCLKKVLYVLLHMGNYLNHGAGAGNAVGFKLNSLWRVGEVRGYATGEVTSKGGQRTLLHLLAEQLDNGWEELNEELGEVHSAAKLSFDVLRSDVLQFLERMKALETASKSIDDDPFFTGFLKFLNVAKRYLDQNMALLTEISTSRVELATYFCENPKVFSLEECFKIVSTLVNQFKAASLENVQRLEAAKLQLDSSFSQTPVNSPMKSANAGGAQHNQLSSFLLNGMSTTQCRSMGRRPRHSIHEDAKSLLSVPGHNYPDGGSNAVELRRELSGYQCQFRRGSMQSLGREGLDERERRERPVSTSIMPTRSTGDTLSEVDSNTSLLQINGGSIGNTIGVGDWLGGGGMLGRRRRRSSQLATTPHNLSSSSLPMRMACGDENERDDEERLSLESFVDSALDLRDSASTHFTAKQRQPQHNAVKLSTVSDDELPQAGDDERSRSNSGGEEALTRDPNKHVVEMAQEKGGGKCVDGKQSNSGSCNDKLAVRTSKGPNYAAEQRNKNGSSQSPLQSKTAGKTAGVKANGAKPITPLSKSLRAGAVHLLPVQTSNEGAPNKITVNTDPVNTAAASGQHSQTSTTLVARKASLCKVRARQHSSTSSPSTTKTTSAIQSRENEDTPSVAQRSPTRAQSSQSQAEKTLENTATAPKHSLAKVNESPSSSDQPTAASTTSATSPMNNGGIARKPSSTPQCPETAPAQGVRRTSTKEERVQTSSSAVSSNGGSSPSHQQLPGRLGKSASFQQHRQQQQQQQLPDNNSSPPWVMALTKGGGHSPTTSPTSNRSPKLSVPSRLEGGARTNGSIGGAARKFSAIVGGSGSSGGRRSQHMLTRSDSVSTASRPSLIKTGSTGERPMKRWI